MATWLTKRQRKSLIKNLEREVSALEKIIDNDFQEGEEHERVKHEGEQSGIKYVIWLLTEKLI